MVKKICRKRFRDSAKESNLVLFLSEGILFPGNFSIEFFYRVVQISKININKRSACQVTLLNKAGETGVLTCFPQLERLKS